MRLCRVFLEGRPQAAFYAEDRLIPVQRAAALMAGHAGQQLAAEVTDHLADLLPHGRLHAQARQLADWLTANQMLLPADLPVPTAGARLLVPVPRPNKIFLLAGNYAEHIREGGGVASERPETFPYVFMKPPSTTLLDPGRPVCLPAVSPSHIDWELELAVVMGARAKGVREAEALGYVAGYTIINDISNRRFRPNPGRKERPKDAFFDWLHGKWHDGFCPCGPCITSAEAVPDPQALPMTLLVNGQVKQQATTALQVFPVAALIEFISSFVTLEPEDIISTGTPAGVGAASGTYLKPGDVMHATIGSIGTLATPVVSERAT
jgi:2-keto-4-pentenoate hydratase/2-oxohepta-3-ene-1,7-dioic acid hydratase in catechol pathway